MNEAKVNEFLQYWAEIYRENPGVEISSKSVYSELVRFGVPQQERLVDLNHIQSKYYPHVKANPSAISPICHPNSPFNNWIQIFSFAKNTDCFVNPKWSYFCQFVSKDNRARVANEHIKIYVPLDEAHIEQGAKQLFGFLDEKGIAHSSKIGTHIRFDNIVIRVVDPNDAEQILNFIKRNPYIQEGLLPANPFAFQKDGIALACDGSKSYNDTVSVLIKMYMDYCRANNRLTQVNVKDYEAFVRAKYQQQFLVHNNNDLYKVFNMNGEDDLRNYREIIGLMIKTFSPAFSYDDYLQHYATCANIELVTEKQVMEVNRLLAEAMEAMTLRFDHPTGYENVRSFFYTGRENLITRKDNLRSRMVNSPFRKSLETILKAKGMTYDQYANMIINQYHIDLEALSNGMGK